MSTAVSAQSRETVQNRRDALESEPDDLVQLLDPVGRRVADSRYDPLVADLTDDRLIALYEDLVFVRRIDTEAIALQRQGELGLWPPLLGQEAAQVGSARALRSDDFVFSSYRESGVAIPTSNGSQPDAAVPRQARARSTSVTPRQNATPLSR